LKINSWNFFCQFYYTWDLPNQSEIENRNLPVRLRSFETRWILCTKTALFWNAWDYAGITICFENLWVQLLFLFFWIFYDFILILFYWKICGIVWTFSKLYF